MYKISLKQRKKRIEVNKAQFILDIESTKTFKAKIKALKHRLKILETFIFLLDSQLFMNT